ncbi:A24 family peptidase [Cupriavidus neocaledonicus]|uniref:PREPILIN PEPTIDASE TRANSMEMBRANE PROTEIN n=1 Tax=Cupriavidus neocaledonicus TaxID=1040979 RepID=A0A375HSC3_9BURK|nr:prepilin peptidase [Cupriavidus neocaledonicus]SOZ39605.1 putative PREPILIN PEPTIDASE TRANSMEMBRANE PROTEIN [Cupriavidus neocaledonicus]SPD61069.1 putative PREPILIN PEPTIDASE TRANSMEMBRANE PROTEIN [Cupriavidus neocaledonicus]
MIAALLCAATLYTDFAYRRVPNLLLAIAVMALGLALLAGQAAEPPLAARLTGAGLGLAVTLPVYALGRMAAGDVKFLTVAGLFTGPQGLVVAWVVGSLLGLVHALLALALARRTPAADHALHSQDPPLPTAQFSPARGIPYAAYLAVGVLAWMAAGQ